ncbi:hypothetical protein ACF07T_38005 [Streptomyces sp. NPDC015184]|uniref:hypothetical protein n=1 Tax=Streptomyces sp. NPDC015184 TaxID=3364946 RepID=UPI0037023805
MQSVRLFPSKDLTSKAAENWSGKWEGGRLVLILCSLCQTPVEHAAAEANGAELTVGRVDGGKFLADPVLCITGTLEAPGPSCTAAITSSASERRDRPKT